MSAFPTTEQGLAEAGYVFDNSGKCRGCGAELAWYKTPKGKSIPLDEGTLVPHWSTCANADDFRTPKPKTGSFSRKTDGYKKGKS